MISRTLEIVALPRCIMRDGAEQDSYVVIAKEKPALADWSIVFVEGKLFNLDCP